jgi:VWFA-related protein
LAWCGGGVAAEAIQPGGYDEIGKRGGIGMALSRLGNRKATKAMLLASLPLIVLVGYAGYQAPPPGQNSFRISVDVALVVLQATVTDRQGNVVTNLNEKDFEISENGVPQHIKLFKNEDLPVAVGLVIDHSTSMMPKLAEVVTAARAFVRSSNRQDQMFVVNFNERPSLGLPPQIKFTDDTIELERAIMTELARGQTALYDAIAMGLERLRAANRDKKALIVISDGGDNASRLKVDQVMNLAGQSSAVIYTVGVFDEDDPDKNPGVLKRLSQSTGGEAFLPQKLGEVTAICERIARDIRHQYTIGYVPSNPARDGSYRAIRVRARSQGQGKLAVRTRTGYIAGSESKVGGQTFGGQTHGGPIAK